MATPAPGTYPVFFDTYISKVKETDLLTAFEKQEHLIETFFKAIPSDKYDFSYAPGKWTLKEMLQHIIDTERIFAYRALCIARKEAQNLPGFDEDAYADNSHAWARNWNSLLAELQLVRQSLKMMFESFSEEVLNYSGKANNNAITVNAIGFATVGHMEHHIQIIKERYLLVLN
ncbi:MAG: DinB family protein [Chitinophagaceae bacterium]|nr:MAG: DinB family protein [Chitinophagaceae bacterium]